MPSVWIEPRPTQDGKRRYRVRYTLGGRESSKRYGGSFRTQREAEARIRWIGGELAAMRVPDLRQLEGPMDVPTLAEACDRWRASRVDVAEGTRVLHRVALGRVTPILGSLRVDEVTVDDVNRMVVELAKTRKRETIRKSVKYAASVFDEFGIDPNPFRDKRVRLPHEDEEELVPPIADHLEAVFWLLARAYRLPLLWLDWSGARVASVENVLIGDYDEPGSRIRLRASTTKTRRALWVELPDVLAAAITATLPPREDRDVDAPLFAGVTADQLRTAIARACKAAGVPVFSPHDLRHRRISLLHHHGRSWAEIGALVGQRKLSITADTYTHVLIDGRELDYERMVA
jgi:integrase